MKTKLLLITVTVLVVLGLNVLRCVKNETQARTDALVEIVTSE